MKVIYYLRKIFMKVIPTKKNRVLFTSFDGHYSDSPKQISVSMHEIDPNLEIVWILENKYFELAPNYVKKVEKGSASADYYYSTAGVLVDNSFGHNFSMLNYSGVIPFLKYSVNKFINFKRNQVTFTTWHGTPLKKMGRDQIGLDVLKFNCPSTEMILGNQYTLDIMKNISFDKMPMSLMGCPRNDILFDLNLRKIDEMKKSLGLPIGKKVVMFAPTFRSDTSDGVEKNIQRSGINQLNEFDIEKMLQSLTKKFGGEWIMVCRFHYYVEEMINWNELKRRYGNKIINGNIHDDMSEYLVCTDVLITDASSSMFDFAITNRPCFLYFPDLSFYEGKERGFYLSPKYLPFPISKSFNELENDILHFDNTSFVKDVTKMMDDFGYVNNSNSSLEIAKYIISRI